MTESSKRVFQFLKENHGVKLTAQDVARALDVKINVITGSVNGLVKKNLATREEGEVVDENGKVRGVKYIALTDEGMVFDPDAEVKAE